MKIFQVPSGITKIQTMAGGLRIIVDTQEILTGDAMERLFKLYNKLGWFTFSVHQIEKEDIVSLPPIKSDSKKTPSQRMRDVIYRIWEVDNKGYDIFDNFYTWYMEKMIDRLKEMINT